MLWPFKAEGKLTLIFAELATLFVAVNGKPVPVSSDQVLPSVE